MEKICSKCKQFLPETEFHKETKSVDGLSNYCKECKKQYSISHRDRIRENNKRYKQTHKEIISERRKAYYRKTREQEIARVKCYNAEHKDEIKIKYKRYIRTTKGLFSVYLGSAKQRDLEWALSFSEFEQIISQSCFYCGQISVEENRSGIDRIDNSQGYVPFNCVACCGICNHMKSNYTKEYFLNKVKEIYEHLAL